jgi:thiol-disulfide isomerase/thioredoxin
MASPTGNPFRAWLWVTLAFVLLWTGYLYVFGPRRPPSLQGGANGGAADFQWTLFDLNDKPVEFSRFQGKTIFLNIWATWCGPCIAEMPSIGRLATASVLKGKPIEFVCVATDDSSEAVRSFLKGSSYAMTFLRADRIPSAFLTDGIPATFIIGPDGRIAASELGASDWDNASVIELLKSLSATDPKKAE